MSPLSFLYVALLVFIVEAAYSTETKRPNIIVIMTDDQDYMLNSTHPAYMPNLDRLMRRRGLEVQHFITSVASCCPSRTSFLTGRYCHNTNMTSNAWPRGGYVKFMMDGLDRQYLPVWLQAAGYDTYHVGKLLNGFTPDSARGMGCPRGWTSLDPLILGDTGGAEELFYNDAPKFLTQCSTLHTFPETFTEVVMRQKALQVIDQAAASSKPFFLFLAGFAPHDGLAGSDAVPEVEAKYRGLYPNVTLPKSPNFGARVPLKIGYYWPYESADMVPTLTAHYRARLQSLRTVDDTVAALVSRLACRGLLENTVLIYTSDNGFKLGNHDIGQEKFTQYEEDVRLPLLLAGPGIPRGVALGPELQAQMTDLTATILWLAGASPGNASLDGAPLPLQDLMSLYGTKNATNSRPTSNPPPSSLGAGAAPPDSNTAYYCTPSPPPDPPLPLAPPNLPSPPPAPPPPAPPPVPSPPRMRPPPQPPVPSLRPPAMPPLRKKPPPPVADGKPPRPRANDGPPPPPLPPAAPPPLAASGLDPAGLPPSPVSAPPPPLQLEPPPLLPLPPTRPATLTPLPLLPPSSFLSPPPPPGLPPSPPQPASPTTLRPPPPPPNPTTPPPPSPSPPKRLPEGKQTPPPGPRAKDGPPPSPPRLSLQPPPQIGAPSPPSSVPSSLPSPSGSSPTSPPRPPPPSPSQSPPLPLPTHQPPPPPIRELRSPPAPSLPSPPPSPPPASPPSPPRPTKRPAKLSPPPPPLPLPSPPAAAPENNSTNTLLRMPPPVTAASHLRRRHRLLHDASTASSASASDGAGASGAAASASAKAAITPDAPSVLDAVGAMESGVHAAADVPVGGGGCVGDGHTAASGDGAATVPELLGNWRPAGWAWQHDLWLEDHASALGLQPWAQNLRNAAAAGAAAAAAAAAVSTNASVTASAAAVTPAAASAAAVAAAQRLPLPAVPGSLLVEVSMQRVRQAVAEAHAVLQRRRAAAETTEAAGTIRHGDARMLGASSAAADSGGGSTSGGSGGGGGMGAPLPASQLSTWSNIGLIESWLDGVFKGKSYRTLRACTPFQAFGNTAGWTCYKYTVMCNPVTKQTPVLTNVELYDLAQDPAEIKDRSRLPWPASTAKLINRLDAVLTVMSYCSGSLCRNPFLRIHPDGRVTNLAQAMSAAYDGLYGSFKKLSYKKCQIYYDPANELPDPYLAGYTDQPPLLPPPEAAPTSAIAAPPPPPPKPW